MILLLEVGVGGERGKAVYLGWLWGGGGFKKKKKEKKKGLDELKWIKVNRAI